jgi:hypothetical protein
MRIELQGIGEVISLSIVKLKILTISTTRLNTNEKTTPLDVYFPMNTKERHIMNVLRSCLEIMIITFGVQLN